MARIAFIEVTATVSYGGVQTAVWKLAEALTELGHEITVFGGTPATPMAGRVAVRAFPFTPRERVPDIGSRFRRLIERLSFAHHARAAVATGGYDWAIVNKPFDFFWPWILPRGCTTRFAFMSGGTDFIPGDRWLARRINGWLACSHFNAWQIHARYKRWPTVIYNGVDIEAFAPQPDDAVRARFGIASDTVLFAFAGRLVGWKGMGVALRALADPALRQTNTKLLIVGDGPQKPELKQLAQTLDVAERVLFHDPVPHDQLPGLYGAADAGVFPSIGDEAFGITIAEAMSCGKPVIASHIGGIPEVVGNEGSCGLLVAPGDVRALAGAMRALALDPVRRKIMGQAARTRIAREFTWTASARRMSEGLCL